MKAVPQRHCKLDSEALAGRDWEMALCQETGSTSPGPWHSLAYESGAWEAPEKPWEKAFNNTSFEGMEKGFRNPWRCLPVTALSKYSRG